MQKVIDNLVLEITRRCNMACAHCMRGDAQNKDMSREIIDRTLSNVSCIGMLTFTGGEPTLNIDIIRYTLEKCKEKHIDVQGFYIVTNGKIVQEDFLITCLRWHAYTIKCGLEPEYSGVALSRDKFHDQIPQENVELLQTLACFRPEDKHTDFNKYGVNPIGRAAKLTDMPKNSHHHQTLPDGFIICQDDDSCTIETMTVTVNGEILSDCDYDYSNIEQITVGHINDPNWLEKHIAKYASDDDVETQMFHVKH